MSALQDCISTLAVIASSSIPAESVDQATSAIDHYVDKTGGSAEQQLAALTDLQTGLKDMKIESSAGAVVWAILCQHIDAKAAEIDCARYSSG